MKEKFKMSLAELKKAWKGAVENKEEFAGGGFEPEPGTYAVVLTSATVGESKSSGRMQIAWEFTWLKDEYKGQSRRFYDGLDKAERLGYVIRTLEALGGEAPDSFDELEDELKKIAKKHPKVKIKVTVSGEFMNFQILKALTEDEIEELGADADPEPEEKPSKADKNKTVEKESKVEFEEGMLVKCKDEEGDDLGEGKIIVIDEDSKDAVVKIDGKKHTVRFKDMVPVKAEKSKKDDGEGEEIEIEVGAEVKALDKDDDEIGVGKIVRIDEKEEVAYIRIDGEKHKVPFEKIRKA